MNFLPFPRRAAAAIAGLALLLPAAAPARGWHDERGQLELAVAGGSLEVAVVPDRDRALRLLPAGAHRWVFAGSTADLVGQPYSIVLRNRTPERLKVVVGVDGLNVYERVEIGGRADLDVGSILGGWGERTLRGWQVGAHRAQRFVFSPPEWSEGEGRTDPQIGLLTVQVYREWRHHDDGGWKDRAGTGEPALEPQAAPRPHHEGDATAERRADVHQAPSRPPIGTTAGEDVASSVRTVRFLAASAHPEAWAVIDYGSDRQARRPWPPWEPAPPPLGLRVEPDPDGTRIVAVAPGSPADRAGLEPWDLIVRIDTVHRPSPSTTRRVLEGKSRGDYAFLRVRRGEHELAFKLRV